MLFMKYGVISGGGGGGLSQKKVEPSALKAACFPLIKIRTDYIHVLNTPLFRLSRLFYFFLPFFLIPVFLVHAQQLEEKLQEQADYEEVKKELR